MSSSETTLDEVVHSACSTARTEETTYAFLSITTLSDVCWVLLFTRSTHPPCRASYEKRTVLVLVVVAAEGLAVDEGERGDDEDDAGRCRSDARAQPSTTFAAAERVGGTVARAGVDIARLREKSFRERPRLGLLEMEAAMPYSDPGSFGRQCRLVARVVDSKS